MERMRGREHERDQQDRAELADGARGQQIGAELRPQLTAVRRIGISVPIAVVANADPV